MRKRDIAIWGFGGLLTLSAPAYIGEGIVAAVGGLILSLTGLLILPPSRRFIMAALDNRVGFDLARFQTVIVIGLVIIGLSAGMSLVPTDTAEDGTRTIATETDVPSAATATPTTQSSTAVATSQQTTAQRGETTQTETRTPTQTSTSSPTPTSAEQRTAWTVTVLEVVDGDTMDVRMPDGSSETIRLLGVDTPETSTGSTDPDEWAAIPDTADGRAWLADWGGQATTYAEQRLAGEEIYIEVDETADRRGSFGRLLVYAYQSETATTSFNYRLLENGYARYYDSEFAKQASFQEAALGAQSDDLGVWGYEDPTSSQSGSGEIAIAQIHEDAAGDEYDNLDDEYIVLENTGGSEVNLDGWTLSDEANHVYTFDGVLLGPGETVSVYTGEGTDSDTELFWGRDAPVWNNGGDTVIVQDANGETVAEQSYD